MARIATNARNEFNNSTVTRIAQHANILQQVEAQITLAKINKQSTKSLEIQKKAIQNRIKQLQRQIV